MSAAILTVTNGHYPGFRELSGLDFKVSVVMQATDLSFDQGQVREQQLQRLALTWNSHDALVAALDRYAKHDWTCKSLVTESRERGLHEPRDPCSCGYVATLKVAKGEA